MTNIKNKRNLNLKHTKGVPFLPISRAQKEARRQAPQSNRTNLRWRQQHHEQREFLHWHLKVTKCCHRKNAEWRISHSAPLLCFQQLREN